MDKTTTLGKAAFLLALLALPLLGASPAPDSDWAQWRGPKRDGLSPDTGLLKEWPAGGPPVLWKASAIGGGFSSVSIQGDQIFTLGDQADGCNLIALKSADGTILWQTKIGEAGGGAGYPGPRSTPSTDGNLVFALGQYGDLLCCESATGKEKWRKRMKADFGGEMMSGWGYAESPLLDGDHLICSPGGSRGCLVALKKETGDVVWQSKELTDKATYASLVPAEIGGVKQYVVLTEVSVAGIAADSGKLLWKGERVIVKATAIAATPLVKDGIVVVSSSYENGTINGFKVTAEGGAFKVEALYAGKQLQNHHGGMILYGDHVYGTDNRALKCLDAKTGKVVWEDKCVGKGSIAFADGHLVVRSEKNPGTIALVDASPDGYKERGRFDPPNASKKWIWPHPVVVGGKMYIRDMDTLLCYDVKAK